MPGKTLQPANPADPASMRRLVDTMQGMFDDPIAMVRVTLGEPTIDGVNYTRRVTMQVVDRLSQTYPPRSFQARDGTRDARWFIWWYIADLKFDAAVESVPTYQRGRAIGTIGKTRVGQTDKSGVLEFDLTRTAGGCWIHTGVPVLMREKGVEWSTGKTIAQTDDEPASGAEDPEESMFPSTPGSHTVCVVLTGAQAVAAYAEAVAAGTSYVSTAVGTLPSGSTITQTSFTMLENCQNLSGAGTFSVGVSLSSGQRSVFMASGTAGLVGIAAQMEQDGDGDGVHDLGTDHDPGATDSLVHAVVVTAPDNEIFAVWQFGGYRPIEALTGGSVSMCITYTVP